VLNKKLLQPGWAGDLTKDELAFIKNALKKDRRLRAKWGLGRGTGRLNDEKIRKVALDGVEGLRETLSEPLRPSMQLRFPEGMVLR